MDPQPQKVTKTFHQDGDLVSNETKDLLPTLPREDCCFVDHIYQYQGFWYIELYLQGSLRLQQQFTSQENDLCLASALKSGTTWLKAMVFAIVNRRNYHSNADNHPLLIKNLHELVPLLEEVHASSRLFATHMPYISLPEPIKAVDSKWYWHESLKRPEKVCCVKYEEMKKEPKLHLMKLAEFLGYPFSSDEEKHGIVDEIRCEQDGKIPSGVEKSSYFRKGETRDYVNYLTPEMIERLDQITEEKFRGSGLQY
ncbi:hypothetical protein MKX03_010337 [Papaver bracteatum]|nr:hypothetical protein MKX03_010337 [Papaver bracteatum]